MKLFGKTYKKMKYIGAGGGYDDLVRGNEYWVAIEKKGKYFYIHRLFRSNPYIYSEESFDKNWTDK